MTRHYHFISGLPRSGSTLLSAILRQNPRFHAGMSSPVAALMQTVLEQTGAGSEFYSFFDAGRHKVLCKGLFDSYYYDKAEYEIIFDTNRLWTARLHQMVELFDDFKVICCVRNPAWIMDSFERIYRRNPFDYSKMFNAASRLTVYTRCEALMSASGIVGSAWSALKEAYYGEFSDRLLLIDYDVLTRYPQRTTNLLYQFLGEPEFQHDFDNVEYEEGGFDNNLGVNGLHTVKSKVEYTARRTVLPPELFQKYGEMDFWQDNTGTEASCIGSIASKELNTESDTVSPHNLRTPT